MYDYLEGKIALRVAGRVVLDVGGVGYEVWVPLNSRLPDEGRLRLWTHHVVREDAQQLYGFAEVATRDVFRALLTVKGVGPKSALAVLSGLERDELIEAILAGDVARLTAVRGVGRRIADQILLDLRARALNLRGAAESAPAALRTPVIEDAIAALMSIGFTDKEARKHIERAAKSVDPTDLDQLVRAALVG